MKLTLKPPGTICLKLHRDMPLSTSAIKFNLRRYTTENWSNVRLAFGVAGRGLHSSAFPAQRKHILWGRGRI